MLTFSEHEKINLLRRCTAVLVIQSLDKIECLKNRWGNKTMEDCKDVKFEKLKLSEIENDLLKIIRKYEGTNLWLSINE